MSETQSVLDQMASGIMSAKKDKAAKLTPVGAEKAPLDIKTPAAFPFDQSDLIQKALADARKEIVFVLEGIDKMIAAFGANPYQQETVSTVDVQREKEREADEKVKFQQEFARMQKEAQAATFADLDEPAEGAPAPIEGGWECPKHGAESLSRTTSRKGRTYSLCNRCEEFEK